MTDTARSIEARAAEFRDKFNAIREEIGKVIVGQTEIVEQVLITLFAGGHCLLEGVPGLGKTMLVRTLADVLDLKFSRIQFTPDIMPADILGTKIVVEDEGGGREFQFQKGPIFGQLVLADEINRATPKTQSALLEAMQEKTVTTSGEHFELESPFLVMATQNPLEMDGTYPLPEAQLDRFLFKVLVEYPSLEELSTVLDRTVNPYEIKPDRLMDGPEIESWKLLVRDVVVAPHVKHYGIRLCLASHPNGEYSVPAVNRLVRFGSSPRGVQAIMLAAKIRALLDSRYNVSFEDLRRSAHPVLRHRLLLNFEGEAEGVSSDTIIDEILEQTPLEVKQVGSQVLDEDFIARLEKLELVSRKIVSGTIKGERRSKRRGHSTDFADYRPYVVGDDLRHVDWNIYGRLDRLFLKVFLEEEDLRINILVDSSPSMQFGDPDKFHYAKKIATALGYIGLVNQDRVQIGTFASRLQHVFGPSRGRRQTHRLLETMNNLETQDDQSTDLEQSCRDFTVQGSRGGILLFVTDFFDRGGFESALRYLLASGNSTEIFVFHVLAPQEISPQLAGDLRLVDSEDGVTADVTISKPLLKQYEATLTSFRAEIQQFCSGRGINYVFTSTDVPFDQLVLSYLRKRGLVQ